MDDSRPWTAAYLEEKYSNPDPWKYFTSPFEQKKYHRQLEAIEDRNPFPGRILEIGSAEGAHTLLLAQAFPGGLGALKNIAFRLLEAWRNLRLEDQAFLALRFFPANTS